MSQTHAPRRGRGGSNSFGLALWTANYLAAEQKLRHSVRWENGKWQVYCLLTQPVGHCSQCGRPLPASACGPTHALHYHRQTSGVLS